MMKNSKRFYAVFLLIGALPLLAGCPVLVTGSGGVRVTAGEATTTITDSDAIVPLSVDGGSVGGDLVWGDEAWFKFTGEELTGYDIRVRGMAGLVVSIFKAVQLLDSDGQPTDDYELHLQAAEVSQNVLAYSPLVVSSGTDALSKTCLACAPAELQEVRLRQFVAPSDATYMISVETFQQSGSLPSDPPHAYYDHFPFSVEVNSSIDVDAVMADNLIGVNLEDAGVYSGDRMPVDGEVMAAFDATAGRRVYIDFFSEDPDSRLQVLYRHREVPMETPFGNGPNAVIGFLPEFTGTFLLDITTGLGENVFDYFLYEFALLQDDHANAWDVYDDTGAVVMPEWATEIPLDGSGAGSTTGVLYAWDDDVFRFRQPAETPSYVEVVWDNDALADWTALEDWADAAPDIALVTDANGDRLPNRFYVRHNEMDEVFFKVVNANTNVAATGYTLNVTPAPMPPRLAIAYDNTPDSDVDTKAIVLAGDSMATFTLRNTGGLPLTWDISKWDLQAALQADGLGASTIMLSAYTGTIAAGASETITLTVDRAELDLATAYSGTLPVVCEDLFGSANFPVAGGTANFTVHPLPPVVAVVNADGDPVSAISLDATAGDDNIQFWLRNTGVAPLNWEVTMPVASSPVVLRSGTGLTTYDSEADAPEALVWLLRTIDIDPRFVDPQTQIILTVRGSAQFDDVTYPTSATVTVNITRL